MMEILWWIGFIGWIICLIGYIISYSIEFSIGMFVFVGLEVFSLIFGYVK